MKRLRGNLNDFIGRALFLVFIDAVLCATALADPTWTVTQLTNNNVEDTFPAISGTNVVWQGWDGHDWEIYSNFAGQLTDNSTDDYQPDISGTNVVWWGYGDGTSFDSEIYSNFAGQLTDNSTDDYQPAISGTNVVWNGWGLWASEIYSNFAGQLTDNIWNDDSPAISGTNVVWINWDSSGRHVYSNFAGKITNSGEWADWVDISGTNVVWVGGGGAENVGSNFDGQLTALGEGGLGSPAISGTNVVWSGFGSSGYGIYSNFGLEIPTNIYGVNVDISGTTVVWDASDGHDYEIFMATYGEAQVIPLPGAVLLGILGLGAAGWKLRKYA